MAKATKKSAAKARPKAKRGKSSPKSKKCQGEKCKGKRHPIDSFPNSPHTEDGKLNYCRQCWSDIMKNARALGKARKEASAKNGELTKPKKGRPKKNAIEVANDALLAANGRQDKLLVQAAGTDEQREFTNEKKALKCAMEWKLKGSAVRIWREVEFQMVLRIVD